MFTVRFFTVTLALVALISAPLATSAVHVSSWPLPSSVTPAGRSTGAASSTVLVSVMVWPSDAAAMAASSVS